MRPMDKPKVVRAVPRTDRNDLYHTVDGYDFIYENPTYGKADVVRPGFFNTFRDELKVGMMIETRGSSQGISSMGSGSRRSAGASAEAR